MSDFGQQTSVAERVARFRGNVDTRERGDIGETIISRYNNAINRTRETRGGLLRRTHARRSLQPLDVTERWRMGLRNSLLLETALATAVGVSSGVLLAWLVVTSQMLARGSHLGFAPSALSFLVFCTLAALRLPKVDTTIPRLAAAVITGLIVTLVVGSVLIQMVGCRFDACINL